jgi:hypothetical protein
VIPLDIENMLRYNGVNERSLMATKKTVPGYEVIVSGTYICTNEFGIKSKKFYKNEIFRLPEVVSYKNGMKEIEETINGELKRKVVPNIIRENASRYNVALCVIRRYYIDERLKEKYPDFVSTKLCEVFSKEPIEMEVGEGGEVADKPIKDMTLSELKQFVDINDLSVILSDYYDLGDKKQAVMQDVERKHKDDISAGKANNDADDLLKPVDSALFG